MFDLENKEFIYIYPSLEQKIKTLLSLMAGGEFLSVVIGENSSGKTTMMKQFMAETNGSWSECSIVATKSSDDENIDPAEMGGHPAYRISGETRDYFIIDDAHNMTDAEFYFLLDINRQIEDDAAKPGFIFFGDPSLRKRFAYLQEDLIPKRGIDKIIMPTLSIAETEDYVEKWMEFRGIHDRNRVQQKDVKKIFDASSGIIGNINKELTMTLRKNIGRKHSNGFPEILLSPPYIYYTAGGIALTLLGLFKLLF